MVVADGRMHERYDGWHRPESLLRWASVTKVLTAGVAHLVVEDGTLSWDTTAADVLEADVPETITVGSLVEHRSGLPRILPAQSRGRDLLDPYRRWTTDRFDTDAIPALGELVDDERASTGEYSNLGYAVLTRVLEVATGSAWIDLIRDRLTTPLGIAPDAVDVAPRHGTRADVLEALSLLRRRPLEEWHIGSGSYVGAGGLVASLPTMVTLFRETTDGGPLDPRRSPHAWSVIDDLAVQNGSVLRSGSIVTLRPDTGALGIGHAVGGLPAFTYRLAEEALTALVNEVRDGD